MTDWETEQKPATATEHPPAGGDEEERTEEPIGDSSEGQAEEAGSGSVFAERARALWPLIVAIILAVLCTYALLRIAGEQRYQSCLQALDTRSGGGTDALSRLVRVQGVKRCSNSPF
jgi:hypothetical protein